MKFQIYTSYYVINIRWQNRFVFHMHATEIAIECLVQLASWLLGIDLIYIAIAIGVLKILHE